MLAIVSNRIFSTVNWNNCRTKYWSNWWYLWWNPRATCRPQKIEYNNQPGDGNGCWGTNGGERVVGNESTPWAQCPRCTRQLLLGGNHCTDTGGAPIRCDLTLAWYLRSRCRDLLCQLSTATCQNIELSTHSSSQSRVHTMELMRPVESPRITALGPEL